MYQDQLMDHYRHSPYRGVVDNPSFSSGMHNPSCGDTLVLTGYVEHGVLQKLMFQGSGCVISQASASLLCQDSVNKNIIEIAGYDTMRMLQLLEISLGPTRLKCALLPLEALRAGLASYVDTVSKESDAQSCQSTGADSTIGKPGME